MESEADTGRNIKKVGKVYLVGAGPGDPGLITVKGLELLRKAEVVVYDYLASIKLLKHVPKDAEFIYAGKKGGGHHAHTQAEINQMLIDHALEGKIVVRLKGGDPFIFGRGGEEIEEIVEAGIPFEVVPGVTSATAAATYAGVPITHRQYTASVAFVTGHEDPTKKESKIAWDKLATAVGTLVFYMGIKNLPSIAEKLIANGRDPKTPVAVVRWASTPEQRSVYGPLDEIAEIVKQQEIKPPAIVVVGDVVNLREKIDWFEKRPLFGKRILVTRTREQASELVARLEDLGADCVEGATIAIEPPDSWDLLDNALKKIDSYHWLLFTSINAIKYFFKRLHEKGMDARSLHGPSIGVVGKATAEYLLQFGIKADLLPEEFTGEGLAKSLVTKGMSGKAVLIPRAMKAREVLPDTLKKAGADVTVAPVYQNKRPAGHEAELHSMFENREIDMVTFTSSSTVTNFIHMLNEGSKEKLKSLLEGVAVAAIGPITADTARENGLAVNVQPEEYTIPALVEAVKSFYLQ